MIKLYSDFNQSTILGTHDQESMTLILQLKATRERSTDVGHDALVQWLVSSNCCLAIIYIYLSSPCLLLLPTPISEKIHSAYTDVTRTRCRSQRYDRARKDVLWIITPDRHVMLINWRMCVANSSQYVCRIEWAVLSVYEMWFDTSKSPHAVISMKQFGTIMVMVPLCKIRKCTPACLFSKYKNR